MRTLPGRINNSLFFRLFLIFSVTVLVFFMIITLSIRQIDENWRSERLNPLPDFYLDNITLIVDNIGVPPDLQRATQLASELSLTIIIRSPHINPTVVWKNGRYFKDGAAPGTSAQTIDFGPLSQKRVGDADYTPAATASSGLTVTFASTTPGRI